MLVSLTSRKHRGVSGQFVQVQRLINAHRYTQMDLSLHQKVIKLVPTFKSLLEAFSSDPKVLNLFIAQVRAYMRPNLLLYSRAIASACKFSKCGKTRRLSVPQRQYLGVSARGTHCRWTPTPPLSITRKERSWVQSPHDSLLLMSC